MQLLPAAFKTGNLAELKQRPRPHREMKLAYFLQSILPGDWAFKLAIVEVLMWVAMLSLVFLGRHENRDRIRQMGLELAQKEVQINMLKEQAALSAVVTNRQSQAASPPAAG